MLLSERRKSEKATYCMIPTVRHSEKGKTMETVKNVVARGWRVKRGMNWRDELAEDLGSSKNSLYNTIMMGSVQFSSVTQLCPTLCDPMDDNMPGFLSITNFRSFLRLMSIESVMPSSRLILCCPLLLPSIFPSIRVFSNESVLSIRWPKFWSFSFSISPSNEYSGLTSFRMDWLDLLLSKRLSRVFSNATVQKHQFFGAQHFL